MDDDEQEISPTLAAARRRRVDLHHALVEVEEAISSPATGREPAWADLVVERLGALRATIEEHIAGTERPGGLYDEVLHRAPRLAAAIERLRAEHPQLRDGTSELITRLRTAPVGTTWSVEECRDDIQRLLGKVIKHRQLGADLVWEAYNLDIGGVD